MQSEHTSKSNGVSGNAVPATERLPIVRGGFIHNVSPHDLSPLPPIKVTTEEEVRAAVQRARAAQRDLALMTWEERADAMKRAAKRMLDQRHEILQLVKREMGKLEVDGLFTEALGPLDAVAGWRRVVGKSIRKKISLNPINFPKKKARIELVPRGVVGIIAPWNYPVAGLYRSVMPALMTGNAVVLKPSEYTPRSSQWFADLLAKELPPNAIQVIHGDGAVGAALLDAGIDACVFTGSGRTGKKVRIKCAELGIPSSIEMGGNDPAIVLADCDVDRTVAGITHWSLENTGQACGAIELCYVDQRIADSFVKRLGSAWSRLRTAEGDFGEVDVSPLANVRQLDVVEAHVQDAIAKGAKLVCGGQRVGRGLGYLPTILDHCTDAMDVVNEETFGPVLAVVRVDGASEAIRRTNAGRYGLGVSIWTRDTVRAERLAERLDVGVVDINNHAMTGAIADLPWSGVRETGFGIANSALSLTTFCHPKAVLVDRNKDPEPFWMPFDPSTYELGDLLSDAQLGRIRSAWKIPVLLNKRLKRIKAFFAQ